MITRPVVRWIVFGICLITMIASFIMTSAEDRPVNNAPVVCNDQAVKR